ncbi:conserved hypothetical protein [Candidatus Nitrotoga fabula]|uniref:Uncharacterized protein n=1 Tax=Candidatus Nitrotoga fabula TaxID=2182327 RepID=A0A916BG67_9PROT|nr:conserved hypothetical protein [Candidatus Nitrotoga fabula]
MGEAACGEVAVWDAEVMGGEVSEVAEEALVAVVLLDDGDVC